jgi:hypothetical protein
VSGFGVTRQQICQTISDWVSWTNARRDSGYRQNHYYFDALVAVGVVCVALIAYNLWGHLIVKFRNNSPNHRQAAVTGAFAHSIDNDMTKSWDYASVASLDVAF